MGGKLKKIFKLSKWIHKYFGLFLFLFLMWMAITGIFLNHPALIAEFSVPGWCVPSSYHIKNWNRGAFINFVFSEKNPLLGYAGGKKGVWKTTDGGKTFVSLNKGLPSSALYRKTNHLFYEESPYSMLLAGTTGGLYRFDFSKNKWKHVPLGESRDPVRKILRINDDFLVFTESDIFMSKGPPGNLHFKLITPGRIEKKITVSLVRIFFDLHDGKAWGIYGKLMFDTAGLILFFLALSGFYIWYFPKSLKRKKAPKRKNKKIFKFFFKYHLKSGIWAALTLLIMAGTGLFMRPPFIAAITGKYLPGIWYPGPTPKNPWDGKIKNALYDHIEKKVIIQTDDGFWAGPADLKKPFAKYNLNVPVFVMGARVFDAYGDKGYLVGSFSGLFLWQRKTGMAVDMMAGKTVTNLSTTRPGRIMVTGYFKTPDGKEFISDYKMGIIPIRQEKYNLTFSMPDDLLKNFDMPLWNYFFEIHNGRIFRDFAGSWYILIIPFGSMLFLAILISGIYDWIYIKILR